MSEPRPNAFERYRAIQLRVEVAFWVVLVAVQGSFSIAVAFIDAHNAGRPVAFWQLLTWELSSQLAMLALVPAVLAFERRFPLNFSTVRRNWPWHLLGSVGFSMVHVVAMVLVRHGVYALAGSHYDFGNWLLTWPYEYLKDARTYALIVGGIIAYRLFLLRLQGEARVLDEPEAAPGAEPAPSALAAAPARPERFLVRKLRREFLIAAADIDWVQAQGNYVGLHVNGHDYLLRATLTDLLGQLDPQRHVRVHRSYAVHLDRIAEIEPLEGGDARLHMRDGTHVPCSRRYRHALQAGAATAHPPELEPA